MKRGTSPQESIGVFVRDSNRIGTQLLREALARERRFAMVDAGNDAADIATAKPGVALISANLEGQPFKGCELVRTIRSLQSDTKSIILIDDSTRDLVLESIRSGARGMVCRNESLSCLSKSIVAVNSGQIWANQLQIKYLLEALSEPIPMHLVDAKGNVLLSQREQEVVRGVMEGLTNREIADRLQLSEHTIKNYLFHIFDKLGVSSRVELILYAVTQLGRTQPPNLATEDAAVLACRAVLDAYLKEAEACSLTPYVLGEVHRDGRGVPVDNVAAYMWFEVAEAMAVEVREKTLMAKRHLQSRMTPEQVTEAQRRAVDWCEKRLSRSGETSKKSTFDTQRYSAA